MITCGTELHTKLQLCEARLQSYVPKPDLHTVQICVHRAVTLSPIASEVLGRLHRMVASCAAAALRYRIESPSATIWHCFAKLQLV